MPSRPQLLLIPGLLCTSELYAPQLPALSAVAHVQVADHTVAASMADIAAVILAHAPQHFALCGLSMGGYLGFEIMRQAPERVTKLALLDTSARPDTPERRADRRATVDLADRIGLGTGSTALLPQMLHPKHQSDPNLLATCLRMVAQTGITHFARQQSAIAGRLDSRPTLATIKVPTLVLVGRQDLATPLALSDEISSGIAGSHLEIIEDCGHLTTLEQPEAVTRALLRWLAD